MYQTKSKKVDTNIFLFKSIPKIFEISIPLLEETHIRFMVYSRFYDDGSFFELPTVNDWCYHYFEKYLSNENNIAKLRVKAGMNQWKKHSNDELSEIQQDARDNFNIDARMDFLYRDESNKCFHQYSFCAPKKFADKACNFYDFNRSKLLKFISYFNRQSKQLMIDGDKPENRIIISDYQNIPQAISNAKRNYAAELKEEGSSLKLSDREFETMLLYAGGASAKQIAYMFDKSTRTVETHMQNIREKTGHADRLSMRRYVIDNGWDDLIKFFFPYIPAEAA